MAKQEKEYRRLPGRGYRRQGSWIAATRTISTLWMSKDHLLCIDSMGGYSEDYKRFYYRDIQAIIVRKTKKHRIWNWVFCLILGICGVVLTVGISDIFGRSVEGTDVVGFIIWGT